MTFTKQKIPLEQLLELYDVLGAFEKLKEHNFLNQKQIEAFELLKQRVNDAGG